MGITIQKRAGWLLLTILLTCALFVPEGISQGRGRGQARKAAKFINGHDARDGRWDGRGPGRRSIRRLRFDRQDRHPYRVLSKRGFKHRRLYRTNRRW
jgi:hypothetical protein